MIALQKLRNKIAADLHDEVGSTLSSMALNSNFLSRKLGQSKEVQPILEQLKHDSEATINSIRDTVWALNSADDSFENLLSKIQSFGQQLMQPQHINFEVVNSIPPKKDIALDINQKKTLWLIAKEALNNAAKYSKAKKVQLSFAYESGKIKMTVDDNGCGFNAEQAYKQGNGLKNIAQRSKESFFEHTIESSPGNGTHVSVWVPLW